MSDTINKTRNMKNNIFAIDAAPAATPPNPNIAATIATIRNITVQRNIALDLKVKENHVYCFLYNLKVVQAYTSL
jgi:hypothetical protein